MREQDLSALPDRAIDTCDALPVRYVAEEDAI
jgi:hypothetical protein